MNSPNDGCEPNDLDAMLDAARAGSISARNELFAKLHAYLSYVAAQHFNPALQAKAGMSDVVQETLLMANREFSHFQGANSEQFRGWIRQILINEIRNLNRHFSTESRNSQKERRLGNQSPDESVHFDIPDARLTPSREFLVSDESRRVSEMLRLLPKEMREVVQLRNWEGLQFNEIAERMGITLSQAAKLWYKALIELQRLNSESEEQAN